MKGGAKGGARDGARRFGFVTGAAVPSWPVKKVVKRPFRDGKRGDAGSAPVPNGDRLPRHGAVWSRAGGSGLR